MKERSTTTGLYALAFCSVSAGMLSCGAEKKQAEEAKPNIIYILADDMGCGDIRALNDSCRIPTPALDKMVANGMTFTDAHSNSAVSTPTRYGTLTGRYAFRSRLKSGVLVGHDPALIETGRETVASLLKKNGYRTACVGKWHLGLNWARKDTTKPLYEGSPWDMSSTENVDYAARVGGGPADCGFDFSYIIPASLDIAPYVYIRNGQVTAPATQHSEGWKSDEARGMWYRQGDVAADFKHDSCLQQLTQQSIQYIREAGASDQPFFLYFPLTAPHTPWLPAAEFRGKSGAGVYGDFVCMVDDVVRQIYQVLEETGQAENTLVIFTSDNGSHWLPTDVEQTRHRANGLYSGMKSDVWEGGHRVPYIATWPAGIQPGSRSAQLLCSTDLMATCAEMLGKELPSDAGEDSFSFWKALRSEPADSAMRQNVIYHSIEGLFGFRQGDWALLDCKGSGGWSLPEKDAKELPLMQLYNLKDDPTEKHNLLDTHADKVATMKQILTKQIEN
ncbi:MAG: sulfatase-like hydrolase/transferase, partial [Tannerellaceae bacterium]